MNFNRKTIRSVVVGAVALAMGLPLVAQVVNGPDATGEAPATRPAVDPATVVISFADQKITAGEFDALLGDLPAETREAAQGPAKRQMAEQLVMMRVAALEAQRRGLDQTPRYARQMELVRTQVLASLLVNQLEASTSEEDLRAYYDQNKDKFEVALVRHILIRTPDSPVPVTEGKKELTDAEAKAKADEIVQRLAKGEDFAAIAKVESDDPSTGANGGALPGFRRGDFQNPPFEDAAFALSDGQVSQPVKTMFGYHIIKMDEKKFSTFDEARDEIARRMRPEKVRNTLEQLSKDANVQYDEAYFGPAIIPGLPMAPPAD